MPPIRYHRWLPGQNRPRLLDPGGGGGGAPSGPAGGDLTGTYPNPDVVNDSHSHTSATLPAAIVYDGDAAGGDLAGTYPNPSVVNDSHAHTASTLPAIVYDGDSAGGDLSGTYPNPAVAKINGATLGTTTATSGRLLVADGSQWVSVAMSGDATITSAGVVTVTGGGGGGTNPFLGRRGILQATATNSAVVATIGATLATDNPGGGGNTTDADGVFVDESSTSTTPAGWRFDSITQYRQGPKFWARIKTGSAITDIRYWIGLFSVGANTSDDPTGDLMAFRFSTVAGDTTWRCLTKDNVTLTNADSGVSVVLSTVYLLEIDGTSPSAIVFSINGSVVQTLSTNLPTAATSLSLVVRVSAVTGSLRTIFCDYAGYDSR